jgi:hypothetical protein
LPDAISDRTSDFLSELLPSVISNLLKFPIFNSSDEKTIAQLFLIIAELIPNLIDAADDRFLIAARKLFDVGKSPFYWSSTDLSISPVSLHFLSRFSAVVSDTFLSKNESDSSTLQKVEIISEIMHTVTSSASNPQFFDRVLAAYSRRFSAEYSMPDTAALFRICEHLLKSDHYCNEAIESWIKVATHFLTAAIWSEHKFTIQSVAFVIASLPSKQSFIASQLHDRQYVPALLKNQISIALLPDLQLILFTMAKNDFVGLETVTAILKNCAKEVETGHMAILLLNAVWSFSSPRGRSDIVSLIVTNSFFCKPVCDFLTRVEMALPAGDRSAVVCRCR